MADQPIKLRELKAILSRYDVSWSAARGRGSHSLFSKTFPEGTFSYPIPTTGHDVKRCYVRGVRKKFRLTEEDGVPDAEFYGKPRRVTASK